MKIDYFFISVFLCFSLLTQAGAEEPTQDFDYTNLIDDSSSKVSGSNDPDPSFFSSYILKPMRFTLAHEVSCKVEDPEGVKNNRTSFRQEYSKYFLNYFYLLVDSKVNAFWGNDHRAKAQGSDALVHHKYDNGMIEYNIKEAFLQFSIADTSVKGGYQVLVWGESDVGAITDVISPRDYSESFFISLDESRIGQRMLTVDQFSPIGDWNIFFIPDPAFNKLPRKGTEYYDSRYSNIQLQNEKSDKTYFEYGLRWKKTFDKNDVSIMAARLIDNNYANRMDGYVFTKTKQRFSMAGFTFNFVNGNFMFKGETAYKMPRAFNDASYQIVKKNGVDTSLGVDYSPGAGFFTLSLEAVNSHVMKWNSGIQGVPQNSNSLVLGLSNNFLHDNLSVRWMTIYTKPYKSYLHSLTTSYKWSDNLTLFLSGYYPVTKDNRSGYWASRDQKQIVFKTQIQF